MKVNGKEYPMWSQFVERKDEFIGKLLEDYDMGMEASTTVTDITLEPNGEDSAYFSIHGKDFTCGFDVHYGGISGTSDKDYLVFNGYGGHTFKINTSYSAENNNND
jgi:hypothetical protein